MRIYTIHVEFFGEDPFHTYFYPYFFIYDEELSEERWEELVAELTILVEADKYTFVDRFNVNSFVEQLENKGFYRLKADCDAYVRVMGANAGAN